MAGPPPPQAQRLGLPVPEEPPPNRPGRAGSAHLRLPRRWGSHASQLKLCAFQEVKQHYEEYQLRKQQQKEEAEQELPASKLLPLWSP